MRLKNSRNRVNRSNSRQIWLNRTTVKCRDKSKQNSSEDVANYLETKSGRVCTTIWYISWLWTGTARYQNSSLFNAYRRLLSHAALTWSSWMRRTVSWPNSCLSTERASPSPNSTKLTILPTYYHMTCWKNRTGTTIWC